MLKQNVEYTLYFFIPRLSSTIFFKVFVLATAAQESQVIVLRAVQNFIKYLHAGDLEKTALQNVLELHVIFRYWAILYLKR
jgi:hypothetical protein